jgi:hypothetical protein
MQGSAGMLATEGTKATAETPSPRAGAPAITAKTKCRKFETNIPRKEILEPQSQFPHSCVCERIIYYHDGSACSAGGNM